MAWLALTPRVPSPRSLTRLTGDVQSVYVAPNLRGSGIGARLIAAVTEEAANLGVETLTVHSSENAVTAYARAGFRSSEMLRELPVHPVR